MIAAILSGLKIAGGFAKWVWNLLPAPSWLIIVMAIALLAATGTATRRGHAIDELKDALKVCGQERAAASDTAAIEAAWRAKHPEVPK